MSELSPRLRIAKVLLRLVARGATTPADALRSLGTDDVDKRRVADDLKLLWSEGLIDALGEGRDRRYVLPPRLLESHRGLLDRLALAIGRDHVRFLDGTALASPVDREAVDPKGAQPALADRLPRMFHFIGEPERHYAEHEDTLDTVVDGLVRSRRLALAYEAGSGPRSYPSAEPLTLVVYRRSLYLMVQEPTLDEPRCLAVDRIREATLGEPFDYPSGWDPAAHFRDVFGVTVQGRPERIVLRFSAVATQLVEARTWHPSQRLTRLPDGGVRLTMKASGSELVRFVLEWGTHCHVEQPAWLKDAVVRELKGALAGYGSDDA